MSSAEVADWQAYEQVTGPLGGERDDALAAMTAFYVVTALGAKKARMDKMLPRWDRGPSQSWQDMVMVARAINKQFGGEEIGF